MNRAPIATRARSTSTNNWSVPQFAGRRIKPQTHDEVISTRTERRYYGSDVRQNQSLCCFRLRKRQQRRWRPFAKPAATCSGRTLTPCVDGCVLMAVNNRLFLAMARTSFALIVLT